MKRKREQAPEGAQENSARNLLGNEVGHSPANKLKRNGFPTQNRRKWDVTATFAVPPSPPPCNPWDTPPNTAASPHPRSRCEDRFHPAAPDARSAAPATTLD